MIHAGIDLHKRFSQIAAIDEETGETWEERLPNDVETLGVFSRSLRGDAKAGEKAFKGDAPFADLAGEIEEEAKKLGAFPSGQEEHKRTHGKHLGA